MKVIVQIFCALFLAFANCAVVIAEDLPKPGSASIGGSPYVGPETMDDITTTDLPGPGPELFAGDPQLRLLPHPSCQPHRAKHISLKEAILLALRNNPDVIGSELQRVSDKFAMEVARNEFMPQFSFNSTGNFVRGSEPSYQFTPGVTVKTPIGTTMSATYGNSLTGDPGSVQVTVEQPVLQGAGWDFNMVAYSDAVDNQKVFKLNFKQQVITSVVEVINSYRSLVQDYNNLAIQKNNLDNAIDLVKQSELKVKAGKVPPSDVLEQKANLASTRLTMMEQKDSLYANYQRFLEALGLISTSQLIIDKTINFKKAPIPSLKECIHLALANNMGYQSALIQLRATRRAVLTAKDALRWKLNLTGSTTVGSSTGGGESLPASTGGLVAGSTGSSAVGPSIGFNLEVPINDVQSKQGVIDARIALERAKLGLDKQKNQLIRTVTNEVNQIHNQWQQVEVGETAVSLKQKALQNAELKLQYGKTSVFEVDRLRDELLSQQTTLVGTKIQYLNSVTTLNQELGLTLEKWDIKLRY